MTSWFSIYLLAPIAGWFVAHVCKFVIVLIASGGKVKDPGIFLRAGGMPSSHTAVMVTLMTVVGARQGVSSALFGIGATVTAIIIYDALNVRRSVGQQGDVLRKVAAHTKVDQPFFTAYGHTPTEVIGGFIVGLLVGFGLLQIL